MQPQRTLSKFVCLAIGSYLRLARVLPLPEGRALLCLLVSMGSMPAWAFEQIVVSQPQNGPVRLIQQAIQNHPDIAAARSERRATEFEIDAARNQFYPTPAAQLRQDKDGPSTVVSLTQPLWTAGKLTAGLNAASSRAESANMAIEEARYTLALRVVTAWTAYLQAHGRESAQRESVDLLNRYAESVSRRILGGASADVDRELVSARLAQAKSDLSAASTARRVALVQLGQLLGKQPTPEDIPSRAGMAGPQSPEKLASLSELIQLATNYSPALRRIDGNLEAARHDADKKRAALWPTINLRAEHQQNNSTPNSINYRDKRVILALEYAPDAGLSTSANIDAAESRIVGQGNTRESTRLNLVEKVQSDYEDYLAGSDRAQNLQRTLEANIAVLASYERLLAAGKRTWLDVLNIARELTSARSALSDTDTQRVAALYRICLHIGAVPFTSSGSPQ